MIEVEQSDEFTAWVHALRDVKGRAAILVRIARMEEGNFGDAAPVGDGVSEIRIHYGPVLCSKHTSSDDGRLRKLGEGHRMRCELRIPPNKGIR